MKTSVLFALLALATGCTPGMMENSARERAQSDCNRIADATERNRCMVRAEQSYGTGGVEQRVPPPR